MSEESRLQFERYLQLLNRRKWVLVIPVVLALVAAAAISYLTDPTYTATATARIDLSGQGASLQNPGAAERAINTYAIIIKSTPLLERVITDLKLETSPQALSGRIDTDTVGGTELVKITAKAGTPEEAAAIANHLTEILRDPAVIRQYIGDAREGLFTVIEPAQEPGAPTSPRWGFNLAAGLLAGVGGGLALALVFEYIDPTLRGVRDLEGVTRLPVLASIPFGVRWKYPPPPVSSDYRLLATKLQTALQDENRHSVLFTSARPDEGNTTVATYTAMAMAQAGLRVLLLDANLNRPDLHKLFNLPLAPGLYSFISSNGVRPTLPPREASADAIKASPVPRLSVLTAGTKMNDPSELLASAEMREFLHFLETQWDAVVIDGPSMLTGAGSVVIAPVVDAVVFVAAEGQASSRSVEEAVSELMSLGAHPLGLVYCKASEV